MVTVDHRAQVVSVVTHLHQASVVTHLHLDSQDIQVLAVTLALVV